MKERKELKIPYPLGAFAEEGGIRFAFFSKASSCGVILYDRTGKEELKRVAFGEEDRVGNVYCKRIPGVDASQVTYLFYEDEEVLPDERGRIFVGDFSYGRVKSRTDFKAGFVTDEFDWEQDKRPLIPYHKALIYCVHVRGFTKHMSSNVTFRGTFAGIVEMIPYLKEIGVTTLELQPSYQFDEMPVKEEQEKKYPYCNGGEINGVLKEQLNYWGYKKGYYYTPKTAYSASDNPVREFKDMVKQLHRNGLEVVMQFYFSAGMKTVEILEILRFWLLEYHVDGFHLMGDGIPTNLLAEDDVLADCKLMYYQFEADKVYGVNENPQYPHLAEYNDSWYYDMRRFLRGEENMLQGVQYQMRHIPQKAGKIHYISNYFGFTLADMVSYDYKHNEENGEDNRDGTDYNCSWNCGTEGATEDEQILALRLKQMKNAMCLLMLSQSTPLIFMGDEFGNSQSGNNNPYCLDNEITWLDWNLQKQNAELFEFWKMLVELREKNSIISPKSQLRLMDYKGVGCPDLSYHGLEAWKPRTESYRRYIGIMLCGAYAENENEREEATIYIAMNMHWEDHEFRLPKALEGKSWSMVFSTDGNPFYKEGCIEEMQEKSTGQIIPARTIAVYIA